MFKRKKNAFTLIELIAVLVIMSILALIVIPLVMTIIRKAQIVVDKRSIDAYGRSIELAVAGYLLDTGKFATDISQLTIEYSGDEVVCETTQINPDSSVYLAGCKVKGRDVTNYTYGSDKSPSYKAYNIGDEVTYNGVDYYVIKDSGKNDSTVTLLKEEPLTVEEVNLYGVGHVNRYTSSVGTAYDSNGYGGMAYYTSESCGYNGISLVYDECTTDYAQSDVKHAVDEWKNAKASLAIEARLITKDEIDDNFEFEEYDVPCGGCGAKSIRIKSTWMYNSNYWYWTMSPYNFSDSVMWKVTNNGDVGDQSFSDARGATYIMGVVRPVIVLPKSAL